MRCSFCATGAGGFARGLSPAEIVDQVLTVQEAFGQRVSNVGELLHLLQVFVNCVLSRCNIVSDDPRSVVVTLASTCFPEPVRPEESATLCPMTKPLKSAGPYYVC